MAPRRVAPRGRAIVALALFSFVLIAAGVIWRRATGVVQARELRALEQRRMQLQAQRAKLAADVREAASRARLAPIAEGRLNMHVPHDSQVVYLRRPERPR